MEKNHIALTTAAALMGLTTLVHVFLGGPENYTPLRTSELSAIPRSTLSVVWHMITAILALMTLALAYISRHRNRAMLLFLLGLNISFALLFIGYSLADFGNAFALPQWTIFALIAALSATGLRS